MFSKVMLVAVDLSVPKNLVDDAHINPRHFLCHIKSTQCELTTAAEYTIQL